MMVEGSAFTRNDVFQMAIRVAFVSAVTYFSIKWLVNQIDPTSKSRKKAEERAREQLRKVSCRAGLSGKHALALDKLTDHEMIIASQLVVPDEINVNWKDIAGLDNLIQELRETVILPIQKRDLFADSRLTQPPKGVLLHGPPGCGKTLIAKATAKEANMSFINLDVSLLTDKWYGETQKLAAAVFSLAVKLQPCIVFIDEIESFLRTRTAHDHEATAMMKTQFMSLWDGLITDPACTVIIMGATNRPQDLDKAIQRRMPATFHVPMPSDAQRERILQLILRSEPVARDVSHAGPARGDPAPHARHLPRAHAERRAARAHPAAHPALRARGARRESCRTCTRRSSAACPPPSTCPCRATRSASASCSSSCAPSPWRAT
ncbi:ATPase family AAA domain-containing protein 1 isoform X3 [Ostrinia furnacalis]|uniref:ATPase family AAA domain-containing protein 1 isoform X3 n=1 Tax=Ostrinia furnacalis TaxID=93504 RepID=UPI00103E5A98|nr:ATPase family AAA domain-containing protein 1 isoform X3 [Ostrinia furnacalis]